MFFESYSFQSTFVFYIKLLKPALYFRRFTLWHKTWQTQANNKHATNVRSECQVRKVS